MDCSRVRFLWIWWTDFWSRLIHTLFDFSSVYSLRMCIFHGIDLILQRKFICIYHWPIMHWSIGNIYTKSGYDSRSFWRRGPRRSVILHSWAWSALPFSKTLVVKLGGIVALLPVCDLYWAPPFHTSYSNAVDDLLIDLLSDYLIEITPGIGS